MSVLGGGVWSNDRAESELTVRPAFIVSVPTAAVPSGTLRHGAPHHLVTPSARAAFGLGQLARDQRPPEALAIAPGSVLDLTVYQHRWIRAPGVNQERARVPGQRPAESAKCPCARARRTSEQACRIAPGGERVEPATYRERWDAWESDLCSAQHGLISPFL